MPFASELRAALDDARRRHEGRWKTHQKTWLKRYGDEARAAFDAKAPLEYAPQVRGVIRKHWRALGGAEGLLRAAREASPELASSLLRLPYWPVGIDEEGRWVLEAPPLESADGLFDAWVRDLRAALAIARGTEPPAAHLRVLGVISKYWLLVDRVYRAHGGAEWRPDLFVGERLMGKHDDLLDALAPLPYLPIGLDENDQWI